MKHPLVRLTLILCGAAITGACADTKVTPELIDAVTRAVPVVVSAAPVVAEAVKELIPSPTPTPKPQGLKTFSGPLTIGVSDNQDLLPLLRTLDGDVPAATNILWRIDDPSIVQIDPSTGRITGASAGQTVVTATLSGHPKPAAQFTVTVTDKKLVDSITITPAKVSIRPGGALHLSAVVKMVDGQISGNVQWSSSDNTVAVVDSSGSVSAIKSGKVTIVAAYAPDTRYKGLCEVTVDDTITATPSSNP